jgi:hypothetical protein
LRKPDKKLKPSISLLICSWILVEQEVVLHPSIPAGHQTHCKDKLISAVTSVGVITSLCTLISYFFQSFGFLLGSGRYGICCVSRQLAFSM